MIDARGYACPQPVVMVQQAVKASAPESLVVLVDDRCAVENITRFASNCGYTVSVEARDGGEFCLTLAKQG